MIEKGRFSETVATTTYQTTLLTKQTVQEPLFIGCSEYP